MLPPDADWVSRLADETIAEARASRAPHGAPDWQVEAWISTYTAIRDGELDLVVVSEVGYFLTPFELWLTLGGLIERLAPGGELVLVSWRHATRGIPLDGPRVHAQVRAVCDRWSVVTLVEEDVLIDVYEASR